MTPPYRRCAAEAIRCLDRPAPARDTCRKSMFRRVRSSPGPMPHGRAQFHARSAPGPDPPDGGNRFPYREARCRRRESSLGFSSPVLSLSTHDRFQTWLRNTVSAERWILLTPFGESPLNGMQNRPSRHRSNQRVSAIPYHSGLTTIASWEACRALVILCCGLAMSTRVSGGTDSVSQTLPPMTEPRPITVFPPRMVAPA